VELVLNKVDALDTLAPPADRARLSTCTAHLGTNRGRSRHAQGAVAELFSIASRTSVARPYADGKALAALYDLGAPIAERRDTADGVRIRARLPRAEAARFARYLVADEHDLGQASAR
jgi:hypothetical protein